MKKSSIIATLITSIVFTCLIFNGCGIKKNKAEKEGSDETKNVSQKDEKSNTKKKLSPSKQGKVKDGEEPPAWYRRFVGKVGNSTGIIHVQKSYKYPQIIIYIPNQKEIYFSDSEKITFYPGKIKAEYKNEYNKESRIFNCEIENEHLTGTLTLSNRILPIDAEENYAGATPVNIYEYSYVEEGEFPIIFDTLKYHYYYGMSAIPEYEVERFERQIRSSELEQKYKDGMKGEIEALKGQNYLTNQSYSQVIYNQNDILITFHSDYVYEGGAHGMYGHGYTHYDLESRKVIELDDVLYPSYKVALPSILSERARSEGAFLYNDQEYQRIEPSNNFLLTPTEIKFIYQPYEIGPFAAGVIEIGVPYKEISHLLKVNGPVKRIMKG